MSRTESFTPREIVSELDRYVIGQKEAKRAVAVALRNRWRRQQVPEELREEIKRLRKQLKRAEVEREILKKATAYFAKESL